jgi:DNA-binding SARP family transcriptional activator
MHGVMTSSGSARRSRLKAGATGMLLLRLSGRFESPIGDGFDLEPKDALLLAYLALEGPTPRRRLATLLWPEVDEERARGNLRQRLLRLKRTTGIELVVGNPLAQLASGIAHDLDEAQELLRGIEPQQIGDMVEWLQAQRDKRQRARIGWLDAEATRAENAGDLATALDRATELLNVDPLSEHAHRRVMKLHYLRGETAAAIAAYERCREFLRRELNAAPSKDTEALRASLGSALVSTPAAPAPRAVPLSVLRPPRLIGRDTEWAALEAAWAAALPAVVLGEAGLGKTRLVTDFARARGAAVVVSARPGDERVVYALTTRLLRQLPKETLAALEAPVRNELARLLPEYGQAAPIGSDAERVRFFNAVGAVLAAAAQRIDGLFVDDLHFADEASVELIRYVAADQGLRWLFAARPAELGSAARELLDAVRGRSAPSVVTLSPLTLPQLIEFIDTLGIEGLHGAESAPALTRQTGGNPLFVLETLKAWLLQRQDGTGTRLPVAANLGAIVDRRIGRLSADAVRLARCAAVAGQDFCAELAAHVLGVRPLDLADAWAELEAAQVFRDGAFAHDLIYEAALASVPPPIARQLHRELARYLSEHSAAPAREADHWLAAGENERALPVLMRSAELARQAMRLSDAAECFGEAANVAERIGRYDEAFAACRGMFDCFVAVDRARLDDALLGRLERNARSEDEKTEALAMRGHARLHHGDYAGAMTWAKRAAERARAAGNEELAVSCYTDAAGAASFMGDSMQAVRILRSLLPWALQEGSDSLQILVLGQLAYCLDNLDLQAEAKELHRRAIDAALRARRFDEAIIALGNLAVSQLDTGYPRAALDAIQEARKLLAACEAFAAAFLLNMLETAALHNLRHYDAALHASERALEDMKINVVGEAATRVHRTCLWIQLGQFARVQRECPTLDESEALPGWLQARAHQMLGRALWSQGQTAAAAERWRQAAQRVPAEGRAVLASMIALDSELASPAPAALARASDILRQAERAGHLGTALATRIRLAHFAFEAGDQALALNTVREALETDPAVEPNDLYRGELWLVAARIMLAGGRDAEARQVLHDAAQTIRRIADESVPAEFRDSFLNRNPINRQLLTLATRLK